MKIELIDSIDYDALNEEGKFKLLYNNFVKLFENELGVPLHGLEHEYKLFILFGLVNKEFIEKAYEELMDTMYYIIDAHNKDKDAFKEMIKKAIENRDEALIHFWKFREDVEHYIEIKRDKYNFNKKTMALFELFPKLIEDIIKREAYLLNEVNIIMGHAVKDNKNNSLYDIIQNLLATPTYDLEFHVMKNLLGVSINQYRNIVAHSSFRTENNKIYATYGNNIEKEMTIDELEVLFSEIYKLRVFTKIGINFAIDFMLAKYPELREKIKIVPETLIIDTNAALEKLGIKIISTELSDHLELIDEKNMQDNKTYFIFDIESKENSLIETIKILFLTITEFFPMFGEKNNLPDLSEVLWILKIKMNDTEEPFHLCISYDEIKILQEHPVGYSEMMSEKIKKQLNSVR